MAVKPIQKVGLSTQRALEEFRLDYNTSLASQPKVWAEQMGDVLVGDSLKDTFPVALDVVKYREKSKGEPEAMGALSKEITIIKRQFYSSHFAPYKRLERGDHAYVQSWAEKPAKMARARQFLRNRLIADLLKNGDGGTVKCFDGLNLFSASHPVNPFDATIKYQGSATWSNLQAVATPLNGTNLTAEKTAFKMVPGPDGEELGQEAKWVLVPTSLDETAYNLLSVQDLLLSGSLDGAGGGTMGTVRNPHFRSGLAQVRAPELPGTGLTADWYIVGDALVPWLLAEDTSDEWKEWDKSSGYAKDTGNIKVCSEIMLEAAALFPHSIRKIKGA